MSLDGGWALIISGFAVLIVGGAAALIWRHVDNAQAEADAARSETAALRTEFLTYKAHVAENYTPIRAAERMETSIFAVITRLEGKVDRLLRGNRGGSDEQS